MSGAIYGSATHPILLSVQNGIARITLNRPDKLNAFNNAMHAAFRGAMDVVEAHANIAALIITGSGRAFCAGQDLSERHTMLQHGEVDLGALLEENYNPLMSRIVDLPFPTIASVNGIAAGAGAALALNCDMVFAADAARFEFSFVKVALGPDSGVSYILPRQLGLARALGYALTGEPIEAVLAQDMGLIWKTVPAEHLTDCVDAQALAFANGPRSAIAAIKSQLRESTTKNLRECLDTERAAQCELGWHPDYREAVVAFSDKRTAQFANLSPAQNPLPIQGN